ncbi:MAG: hypothetical protein LBU83_11075 [Bacteroidales bacterium]|jgi:hypothetical protein|nr:hypothetical protein [Bacteroidales bacterium]
MKKYEFLIVVIGVIFLFFSCNKNQEGVITLKIGKVTEIKVGKTAENSQKGLSLRVDNLNESRCPTGAMCVWEGYASVELHLTTKNGKHDFTLDTHHPPIYKNDTIIEGLKYELIDILPYPILDKEQLIKTVKILVSDK